MAKTKTPFFSLKAHGSVGESITAQDRGCSTLLRQKPFPTDPYSLPQAYQRWLYEDYAHLWTLQTEATRNEYRSAGVRFHLTGFQNWMKDMLTRLPDIVGWWKFEPSDTGVFKDSSKNNTPGVIIGASFVPGFIGQALSYDGINDFSYCLNVPAIQSGLNDFTWEWLLQYDDVSAGFYLAKWAGNRGLLAERRNTAARFRFYYTTPGYLQLYSPPDSNFHDLQHHCVTLDRDGFGIYYLDGVPGTPVDISAASGYSLQVSDMTWGGAPGFPIYRKAVIDNFIFYNRVLDPTEVLRHSERRYPV